MRTGNGQTLNVSIHVIMTCVSGLHANSLCGHGVRAIVEKQTVTNVK